MPTNKTKSPVRPIAPDPTPVQPRGLNLDESLRPFVERAHRFIGGEHREWGNHDLARVGAYLEIVENDSGCTTPFEEFISHLVFMYALRDSDSLTPDGLKNPLEDFREHFEDAIRTARIIARRHPDLVNADQKESTSDAA